MRRISDFQQELMRQFRETRGQILKSEVDKQVLPSRGFKEKQPKPKTIDYYHQYLNKAENLQENISLFKTRDFMYHFKELSNQAGNKYVISNPIKDMGIVKRCLVNYTKEELILMMEFLFNSDQDYLNKKSINIGILISAYCNTIYSDSLAWANDEYVPRKRKTKAKREYSKTNITDTKTNIGEWEE